MIPLTVMLTLIIFVPDKEPILYHQQYTNIEECVADEARFLNDYATVHKAAPEAVRLGGGCSLDLPKEESVDN